jgi:tRNA 2-thiouridine synthesizing protein E
MLKTDKEGFLLDLDVWNESVANELADNDQLKLTDDHWQVIYFLRDFYQQYQTAPTMRVLVKELAKKLGAEKGNSIYLQRLFPGGLLRQASKIAGLPKPTRCV